MTQHISRIMRSRPPRARPTGYLHLGHARTFWVAQQRAQASGGMLVLRNEDLDSTRFKLEFVGAMLEDLKWFGFDWQEGPDCGGPFGPYNQSERREFYLAAMRNFWPAGSSIPAPARGRTCGGRCPLRTRARRSRCIREPAARSSGAGSEEGCI